MFLSGAQSVGNGESAATPAIGPRNCAQSLARATGKHETISGAISRNLPVIERAPQVELINRSTRRPKRRKFNAIQRYIESQLVCAANTVKRSVRLDGAESLRTPALVCCITIASSRFNHPAIFDNYIRSLSGTAT